MKKLYKIFGLRKEDESSPTEKIHEEEFISPKKGTFRDAELLRSLDLLVDYKEVKEHLCEPIGKGGSASVFKAKIGGMTVAVKIFPESMEEFTDFDEELEILTKIKNFSAPPRSFSPPKVGEKYIIQLIGVCIDPVQCIITEYAEYGSLRSIIEESPDELNIDVVLSICKCVTQAMIYLHGMDSPVLHRDLKSANVVITEKGEEGKAFTAKLIDFGISRQLQTIMTGNIGTPGWIAPEILLGESYGKASDVYSFAMLCYEMLTSSIPFDGLLFGELTRSITEGKRPSINQLEIHKGDLRFWGMEVLIKACWKADPKDRLSFLSVSKYLSEI